MSRFSKRDLTIDIVNICMIQLTLSVNEMIVRLAGIFDVKECSLGFGKFIRKQVIIFMSYVRA